jgi:hypothetical protein
VASPDETGETEEAPKDPILDKALELLRTGEAKKAA